MSPETRVSKRRKISHTKSSHVAVDRDYTTRLIKLNALPTSDFLAKYVPSKFMSFAAPKQSKNYRFDFYSAKELPVEDYSRCYKLLKETSKHDYKTSSRGWYPEHKKREMKEKSMRYFILRRENTVDQAKDTDSEADDTPPASEPPSSSPSKIDKEDPDEYAFLSYQLDDDWTSDPRKRVPVVYIYEIHLTATLRGMGLGKHLMELAEHIATVTKMTKLELSVFTINASAERFYRGLGYDTDETSPPARKVRGRTIHPDWLVLSKMVKS